MTAKERRKLVEKPLPQFNIIKPIYFSGGTTRQVTGEDFGQSFSIKNGYSDTSRKQLEAK